MPTISITDTAIERGKAILSSQSEGMSEPGLRVRIQGGGCSGLMYQMAIEDGPVAEDEEVIERDGFRVYIDKKSLFFLNGSELDYMDGLTGAGFKFRNPNATGTCGCGESFSV